MKPSTIVELNKIRCHYFWNCNEINIDWSKYSVEAKRFVEENGRAMYSTKDTYFWVKENFGIELTPFQIFEINCMTDNTTLTEEKIASYHQIYGDTKSIFQ